MAKRPPSLNRAAVKAAPRKWAATSRRSRKARGYGPEWDRLRADVLKGEPLCRACKAEGRAVVAACVDHIVPKSLGGSDARGNLQPLCGACHKAKTAREGVAARRRTGTFQV